MENEEYKKVFHYIVQEIKSNYQQDIPIDIDIEYYTFKQNFFRYLGTSEYSKLSDYSKEVLIYIENTYPYCFMPPEKKNVDDAIKLYVLSLGGTPEQVNEIINIFKNTQMNHIEKKHIREMLDKSEMMVEEANVDISEVIGTSVKNYQYSNLYDVLEAINDKNLNSYISYLVLNNIFNNEKKFKKLFHGISITIDNNGSVYINEGNHRIITYIALLKIRDYLKINSESKNYQVTATTYKSIKLSIEQNRKSSRT